MTGARQLHLAAVRERPHDTGPGRGIHHDRVEGLTLVGFSLFFVSRAFMEREFRFGGIAVVSNLSQVLGAVVLLVTAIRGHGAWAFVWGDVATRVSEAVLYQAFRPYRPRAGFDWAEVRGMVTFGAHASGSRLLYNFYTQADYLVVGRWFSEAILGLYSFASRVVADPVRTLATIVNSVA